MLADRTLKGHCLVKRLKQRCARLVLYYMSSAVVLGFAATDPYGEIVFISSGIITKFTNFACLGSIL